MLKSNFRRIHLLCQRYKKGPKQGQVLQITEPYIFFYTCVTRFEICEALIVVQGRVLVVL